MTLPQIIIFIAFAGVYVWLIPARWRGWVLFAVSVLAIYALQPTLPIRRLDYSLPTLTLFITAICWFITRPSEIPFNRSDRFALIFLIVVVLALTLTRYIDLPFALTSRPPPTPSVILTLIIAAGVVLLLWRIFGKRQAWLTSAIVVLIGIFIVIKMDALVVLVSIFLRGQAAQDATQASPLDIRWLGFSYVAFRLIHTLRDRQTGKLPALTLNEYVTYVIFFPAYAAGPIDRAERFVKDYRALIDLDSRDVDRLISAAMRISVGLFKKFVIADSLAVFSLNAVTAQQVSTTSALWLLLYGYSLRLYLDFSGYSDIAIGIGLLFGMRLPENFKRPYLQRSLSAFWQSWHITLSDWVRFYIYLPLSRYLLRYKPRLSNHAIILVGSLVTMLIIGLWHGVTLPFAVWGLWHGFGLFAHRLWSDRTRNWYGALSDSWRRIWHIAGTLITFHFVTLGWVWFALPDLASGWRVFRGLFRISVP